MKVRSALVLAAGLGTRLRPLSHVRAKPAVPIAGEPAIRRILRWLRTAGVRDVVLNLHYRPETIVAHVGDGSDLGLAVRYSWEQPVLGSAGGPRHALPLLATDPFFIVNSDLTDVDLAGLAEAHAASGALVTMALTPAWDRSKYGGVLVDGSNAVTEFVPRRAAVPARHFVGVQVACREAFAGVVDGVPHESTGDLYRTWIAERPGSIKGFVSRASFWDTGTPVDYLASALAIAARDGFSSPPLGRRSTVDPSSRLTETVVWDDVTIAEGCELQRCVVADGVRIPPGSRFRDAAVLPAAVGGAGGDLVGDLRVAPLVPVDGS